jgi:hypothetical protein
MPLYCLCSVTCAQFCLYASELSLFCALCPILPVCLWIVFVLCLVADSACMSLDFLCAVSCAQFCLYVSGLFSVTFIISSFCCFYCCICLVWIKSMIPQY